MTSCKKRPRNHRSSYLAILCRVCFSFSPPTMTPTLLFMHFYGIYAIMVDCCFLFSFALTYSPATGYEVVAVNGASGLWELSNGNGTIEQGKSTFHEAQAQ